MLSDESERYSAARRFLRRPRASTNVRVVGWLFSIPMNLISLSALVTVVTTPNKPHPVLAYIIAGTLVLAVLGISARFLRVGVLVRDQHLIVRNLSATTRLPLGDIANIQMGDMSSQMQRAGLAILRNGESKKIGALSSGSISSDGPSGRTMRIVESVNLVIGSATTPKATSQQ